MPKQIEVRLFVDGVETDFRLTTNYEKGFNKELVPAMLRDLLRAGIQYSDRVPLQQYEPKG